MNRRTEIRRHKVLYGRKRSSDELMYWNYKMLWTTFLDLVSFIPNIINNFERVKAPKIDNRKRHDIALILCRLRSSIYRQLSCSSNSKLFMMFGITSVFFWRVETQACDLSEKMLYEKSQNICLAGPELSFPCVYLSNSNSNISTSLVSMNLAVRSATGYCTRCEDWVEIYYPSRYCPKCGKKILDAWPLGH